MTISGVKWYNGEIMVLAFSKDGAEGSVLFLKKRTKGRSLAVEGRVHVRLSSRPAVALHSSRCWPGRVQYSTTDETQK